MATFRSAYSEATPSRHPIHFVRPCAHRAAARSAPLTRRSMVVGRRQVGALQRGPDAAAPARLRGAGPLGLGSLARFAYIPVGGAHPERPGLGLLRSLR